MASVDPVTIDDQGWCYFYIDFFLKICCFFWIRIAVSVCYTRGNWKPGVGREAVEMWQTKRVPAQNPNIITTRAKRKATGITSEFLKIEKAKNQSDGAGLVVWIEGMKMNIVPHSTRKIKWDILFFILFVIVFLNKLMKIVGHIFNNTYQENRGTDIQRFC